MRTWISCRLDEDGNVRDVGKVAYRDGHAIKCTVTLTAKNGEVTRDDDKLKVVWDGCEYAAFVPVALEESYSLDELVKPGGRDQSQMELVAGISNESADEEGQATELVDVAADSGKSWW